MSVGNDIEEGTDDTIVGDIEDGRVWVGIDCKNGVATFHVGDVLDRARDTDGEARIGRLDQILDEREGVLQDVLTDGDNQIVVADVDAAGSADVGDVVHGPLRGPAREVVERLSRLG